VIQAEFARNAKHKMQLCEIKVYPFRLSGENNRNDYKPVPAKEGQQEAIIKKLELED
jgi:hypothetical protein